MNLKILYFLLFFKMILIILLKILCYNELEKYWLFMNINFMNKNDFIIL